MLNKKFLLLGFVGLLSAPAYAQNDIDALLDMDIEALSNISVSTASKRTESVDVAPAVMTVITSEEIKKYGGNNLQDVLRRVPGVYTVGSYTIRDSVSSIRGHLSDTIDRHQLILLNGRPLRESYAGGINTQIYRGIPLDAIEQIEVIRGPGSVLYGTNAFAGVINIITRDAAAPQPEENNTVTVGYGSFNTKIVEGSTYQEAGDVDIYGAGRYLDSDGFTYKAYDAANTYDEDNFAHKDYGGFGQVKYGDFKIDVFRAAANDQVFGLNPFWPFSYYRKERTFADLQYDLDITDDWQAQFNITYNGHNIAHENEEFVGSGHNWLYEAMVNGALTDKINLMVGANYNNLRVSDKPSTTHSERILTQSIWQSGYAQLDMMPADWLKLVGGFQMNFDNRNKRDVSPRAGAVVRLHENWDAKFLYGTAFRSPYAAELSINIPGIVNGNPDLKPEQIETYDAQIAYHTDQSRTAFSYFVSNQTDTVVLDPGSKTFVNGGDVDFHGFEFEAKHRPVHNFELQGSVSYQTSEDSNGVEGTTLIPEWMVKVGATYETGNGFTFGVFNSYFSAPTDRNFLAPTPSVNSNPDAEAYNHLSVNATMNLGEVLEDESLRNFELSLYGDNLLEDDPVYFPDPLTPLVNTLPQRAGRSFYLRLTTRF